MTRDWTRVMDAWNELYAHRATGSGDSIQFERVLQQSYIFVCTQS